MKLPFATAVALLSTSALATSGYHYNNCKPDRCLNSLQAIGAAEDCMSYLKKTVTPCPATKVKTVTITVTQPQTTTVLQTAFSVPTMTVEKSVTSTTTIFDVATVQLPSGIHLTSTVVIPATATIAIGAKKRVVAPSVCHPKTRCAAMLPKCAKGCSRNKEQFVSACSCLGITPHTTTLRQSTITSTSTKTTTTGSTITITSVKTVTMPFTKVETKVVPVTVEETTSTASIASLFTDLTVVSITSTTSIDGSVPTCATFSIRVKYGNWEDFYVSNDAKLTWGSSQAGKWYLSGTKLKRASDGEAWYGDDTGNSPVEVLSSSNSNNIAPLICEMKPPGSLNDVACTRVNHGNDILFACPPDSDAVDLLTVDAGQLDDCFPAWFGVEWTCGSGTK